MVIHIISPNGQLITERKIAKTEGTIEFDVSNYSSGTYFAKVQIGSQNPVTHCFVVL